MRYQIRKVGKVEEDETEEDEVIQKCPSRTGTGRRLHYTYDENDLLKKECAELLKRPKFSAKENKSFFLANPKLKPLVLKFGIDRLQVKIKMIRQKK